MTYGYQWNEELVTKVADANGSLVTLPEYYRLQNDGKTRTSGSWPKPDEVPAETGLGQGEIRPRPRSKPGALRHARRAGEFAGRSPGRRPGRSRRIWATAAW